MPRIRHWLIKSNLPCSGTIPLPFADKPDALPDPLALPLPLISGVSTVRDKVNGIVSH